jgi:hypothetical protein
MARTQRSDHESFPSILIFLLILTSVGTISFIFFGGGQGTLYPTSTRAARNSKGSIADNQNVIEKPLSLVREIISSSVLDAEVIYIIPGGGSGSDLISLEYPEWSKQRVVAAHRHSQEKIAENKKSIFLTLSAGSLNAPNLLQTDGRIMFECQFMIAHLLELEVASDRIYGDTQSWDTVSNAQVARQFLEGLLALRKPTHSQKASTNKKKKRSFRDENGAPEDLVIATSPLQVEIFISDFHAERVKAAFNWVFSLEPSLFEGRSITVAVHSVSTEDIIWSDRAAYEDRMKHEEEGVQRILKNSKIVTTMAEFNAFILLGGHTGFDSYLKNSYQVSQGAGWSE